MSKAQGLSKFATRFWATPGSGAVHDWHESLRRNPDQAQILRARVGLQ